MERAQYACLIIGILVAVYGLASVIKKQPPLVKPKDIKLENMAFYGLAVGLGCIILGLFWAAFGILLFSPYALLIGSAVMIAGILLAETRVRK